MMKLWLRDRTKTGGVTALSYSLVHARLPSSLDKVLYGPGGTPVRLLRTSWDVKA
jgi:hypothetical protein